MPGPRQSPPFRPPARRALGCAIVAAALVLATVAATRLVPLRGHEVPATTPPIAAAAQWPGAPIVRAPLPRALSAAAAGPAATVRNITTAGSLNWAGYAVSRHGIKFSLVRATFFVPYLTCSKSRGKTLSSDWVGLDGFVGKPDSVEQGGIGADCSSAGKASYYAWWEMFPRPETRVGLKVRPGDSVTATISYSTRHHDFTITLADATRGGHVKVTRQCPHVKIGKRYVVCPRNSAEVISEAPATGTSANHVVIAHLSDYDAVSYAAIAITNSGGRRGTLVSPHWNTTKIIQLRSSGAVVAQPTSTQAASFDDYWLREN
jgi:hypothetical protein